MFQTTNQMMYCLDSEGGPFAGHIEPADPEVKLCILELSTDQTD